MATPKQVASIPDNLRSAVIEAVRLACGGIRWKPGKAEVHLAKRIRLGRLPPNTPLSAYEAIIKSVLNNNKAHLHLYIYGNATTYPTLQTKIENKDCVVIIDLNGIIETAFPPDDITGYLADPAYWYVGLLEDFG